MFYLVCCHTSCTLLSATHIILFFSLSLSSNYLYIFFSLECFLISLPCFHFISHFVIFVFFSLQLIIPLVFLSLLFFTFFSLVLSSLLSHQLDALVFNPYHCFAVFFSYYCLQTTISCQFCLFYRIFSFKRFLISCLCCNFTFTTNFVIFIYL